MTVTEPIDNQVILNTVENLFNLHESRITKYFNKMTSSPEEAKSLTMVAFDKIKSKIETINPEENMTLWMYSIVNNVAMDHMRNKIVGE